MNPDKKPSISTFGYEKSSLIEKFCKKNLHVQPCRWIPNQEEPPFTVHFDFNFKEYKPEIVRSIEQISFLKDPCCHVFILNCDPTLYLSRMQLMLGQWLTSMRNANVKDWLIVLVNDEPAKLKDRLPKLKAAKTFESKIVNSFNIQNPEKHILEIFSNETTISDESLNKLMDKLRNLILSAIHRIIERFHRTIYASLHQMRESPATWNFFEHFCINEELCDIYNSLSIYEKSLQIYDAMEALFQSQLAQFTTLSPPFLPDWMVALRTNQLACLDPLLLTTNPETHLSGDLSRVCLLELRAHLIGQQSCLLQFIQQQHSQLAQRAFAMLSALPSEIASLNTENKRETRLIANCWVFLVALNVHQSVSRLRPMNAMPSSPASSTNPRLSKYATTTNSAAAESDDATERFCLDLLRLAANQLGEIGRLDLLDSFSSSPSQQKQQQQPIRFDSPDQLIHRVMFEEEACIRQVQLDLEFLHTYTHNLAAPISPTNDKIPAAGQEVVTGGGGEVDIECRLRSAVSSAPNLYRALIGLLEKIIGQYKLLGMNRRANHFCVLLGNVNMRLSQFQEAKTFYREAFDFFITERWNHLAVPLLIKIAHCQKMCLSGENMQHTEETARYLQSCVTLAALQQVDYLEVCFSCPLDTIKKHFAREIAQFLNKTLPIEETLADLADKERIFYQIKCASKQSAATPSLCSPFNQHIFFQLDKISLLRNTGTPNQMIEVCGVIHGLIEEECSVVLLTDLDLKVIGETPQSLVGGAGMNLIGPISSSATVGSGSEGDEEFPFMRSFLKASSPAQFSEKMSEHLKGFRQKSAVCENLFDISWISSFSSLPSSQEQNETDAAAALLLTSLRRKQSKRKSRGKEEREGETSDVDNDDDKKDGEDYADEQESYQTGDSENSVSDSETGIEEGIQQTRRRMTQNDPDAQLFPFLRNHQHHSGYYAKRKKSAGATLESGGGGVVIVPPSTHTLYMLEVDTHAHTHSNSAAISSKQKHSQRQQQQNQKKQQQQQNRDNNELITICAALPERKEDQNRVIGVQFAASHPDRFAGAIRSIKTQPQIEVKRGECTLSSHQTVFCRSDVSSSASQKVPSSSSSSKDREVRLTLTATSAGFYIPKRIVLSLFGGRLRCEMEVTPHEHLDTHTWQDVRLLAELLPSVRACVLGGDADRAANQKEKQREQQQVLLIGMKEQLQLCVCAGALAMPISQLEAGMKLLHAPYQSRASHTRMQLLLTNPHCTSLSFPNSNSTLNSQSEETSSPPSLCLLPANQSAAVCEPVSVCAKSVEDSLYFFADALRLVPLQMRIRAPISFSHKIHFLFDPTNLTTAVFISVCVEVCEVSLLFERPRMHVYLPIGIISELEQKREREGEAQGGGGTLNYHSLDLNLAHPALEHAIVQKGVPFSYLWRIPTEICRTAGSAAQFETQPHDNYVAKFSVRISRASSPAHFSSTSSTCWTDITHHLQFVIEQPLCVQEALQKQRMMTQDEAAIAASLDTTPPTGSNTTKVF